MNDLLSPMTRGYLYGVAILLFVVAADARDGYWLIGAIVVGMVYVYDKNRTDK